MNSEINELFEEQNIKEINNKLWIEINGLIKEARKNRELPNLEDLAKSFNIPLQQLTDLYNTQSELRAIEDELMDCGWEGYGLKKNSYAYRLSEKRDAIQLIHDEKISDATMVSIVNGMDLALLLDENIIKFLQEKGITSDKIINSEAKKKFLEFEQKENSNKESKKVNLEEAEPTLVEENYNRDVEDNFVQRNDTDKSQKLQFIRNAISETYKKYSHLKGQERGKAQVQAGILKYIKSGDANFFTRDNDARRNLVENVNNNEVLDLLAEEFINSKDMIVDYNKGIFENSIILKRSLQNITEQYGIDRAKEALKNYITESNVEGFGNDGKAIMETTKPWQALDYVVQDVIYKEITLVEKAGFEVSEFAKLDIPKEKQVGVVQKAMDWIKFRMPKKQIENPNKENSVNKSKEHDNFER